MTRKRITIGLGLVVAIVLVVLALIFVGFPLAKDWYFYPNIPDPDYPPPADRAEAWQQDLDYFKTQYIRLNRPYTDDTRREARELIDTLAANIDTLSDTELKLGIARAIALSQNGHSAIWIHEMTVSEGRIPLLGRMFEDGYYFLWVLPQYRDLLGAELVSIDGHPIETVIAAFRPYSGARESHFRMLVGWLLETPSLVHSVGYADSPTGYTLGVRRMDSDDITEVTISADELPLPPPIVGASSIPARLTLRGWMGLPSRVDALPFYLNEWDEPFNYRIIESINAFYIRYGANDDVGDSDISAFNRTIETDLRQNAYDAIIVDQRSNGGGDYTLTQDIMADLPRLAGADTPIYILTGPLTFSAGISSVAFLMDSGGDRVTVLGTDMGDFERSWGESSSMMLPNSGLGMSLATGLHDYFDGCHEFPNCYWLDFFNNVAVGSMSPDVVIPFTFEDYVMGRDAVIDYIIALHSGT